MVTGTPNGTSELWLPPGAMSSGEKAAALAALSRSVVNGEARSAGSVHPAASTFLLQLSGMASDFFPAWGTDFKRRDRLLREFVPTEHFLASAVSITATRNAALSWTIRGDEHTAEAVKEMLLNANFGGGWEEFVTQTSIDLYTQDSGAFVELVRDGDSEAATVIGINHLDAARCFPTGDAETPVIYEDARGRYHAMKWYQVVQLLEVPAAITPSNEGFFFKLQYSAVTRLLRAAQIMQSVSTYMYEKTTGRYSRGIHLVQGVNADEIRSAISQTNVIADNAGLTRYMVPIMVSSLDPNATVSSNLLELASLPDGFSAETEIKNYILVLAMAFMTDYQEFAPLPGGNLGTSSQSEVLHMKSRGKGSALFQKLINRLMNLRGVLPDNVEFDFEEPDLEAEREEAEIAEIRGRTRSTRILSGELTPEAARQEALDHGDMSIELFEAIGGQDVTPDVTVTDEQQTDNGFRSVGPDGLVVASRAKRAVPFGQLIASRLHRAYSDTADDANGLGYFDTLDDRLAVGSAIGPAIALFEEALRDAGVWEITIDPADADRIVESSFKALTAPDRAGPDDERLAFEDEIGTEIGKGLTAVRRRIEARLREELTPDLV